MKYTDRYNIRYLKLVPTYPHFIDPIFEKCRSKSSGFRAAINSLNQEAIKRNLPGFELSNARCYKVHAGYNQTLPEDFITRSDLKGVQNFTMIINYWTGVFAANNRRTNEQVRVAVSPSKYQNIILFRKLLPPYSNGVEEMTIKYLKNLTNGKRFIGVQIRAERVWEQHDHDASSEDRQRSEECIQNCYNAAQNVSKEKHYNMTFYFGDHLVGKLYGHLMPEGVSLSHFDPSKFNAIQNNGLISQVEQNTLSYAETLVLCGGGNFQLSIEARFKKRNPNGTVSSICR